MHDKKKREKLSLGEKIKRKEQPTMYKIMHKTEVIALADEENITEIINKALCPNCFVVGMPLYIWLDNRCVDMHRSHSRKLFKALRLRNSENTAELISIGHGVLKETPGICISRVEFRNW